MTLHEKDDSMSQLVGPFTIEVKPHFSSESGKTIGSAVVSLAPGQIPTREDVMRAIGQMLAVLPEGCRLLDGGDFFNKVLVKEKTGRTGNFAVPRDFQYDVDALEAEARIAFPKPDRAEGADDSDDEDGDDFDDDDDDDDFDFI